MRVLSLFDGISCGRVALDRAGITVNKYYASEIDKYAIQISKKNHPDIIHLGDVTKWKEWDTETPDLIIGGSPCQGFSFAGKQLNFDDPRSKLFFAFVDIVNHHKPKYFLLENVKMKKEYQDIISDYLGVQPVEINSSLVSAQNRKRLYWFNWNVCKPKDKEIYLKDIIEKGIVNRNKSYCLDANYWKGGNLKSYFYKKRRQLVFNRCLQTGEADINGMDCIKRAYDINGKSPTLTTMGDGHREHKITLNEKQWRKLTPVECERLQTLPDNYTDGVSATQRYKMLGNGWTVDVIAHIFKGLT